MSETTMNLHPDALFVVACPVCQGHVAAAGSVCGHDACCPLCASLFHVPFPPSAAASSPAPQHPAAADAEPPAALGEDWEGVIGTLAPPRREQNEPGRTTVEPAGVEGVDPETPPAPASSQPEPTPPPAGPEPLPSVGEAAAANVAELAFKEPVRTVRVGREVIEIRRLSPEERRARRIRRNLLMIVVGVSILLAIVVLAGFPSRRP